MHAPRGAQARWPNCSRCRPPRTTSRCRRLSKPWSAHGDTRRGKLVFEQAGTCANCHKVTAPARRSVPTFRRSARTRPRSPFRVGPLPHAGISHNYETYVVETKTGTTANGVLVSQTPEQVTLKGADALVRTFKRSDLDLFEKSTVSLMPADLHKALSEQDLADLVEYLLTLKEVRK